MERVNFAISGGLTFPQKVSITSQRLSLEEYCFPPIYTSPLIMLQRFSIQLRSGDDGGHCIRRSSLKFFEANNLVVSLDV